MQIGIIGLGKMGGVIARRLCESDIHVVGLDIDPGAADALKPVPGFEAAYSLDALLLALPAPRIVWLMLPAGVATAAGARDLLHPAFGGRRRSSTAPTASTKIPWHAPRISQRMGIALRRCRRFRRPGGLENGYCHDGGRQRRAVSMLERLRSMLLAPRPTAAGCTAARRRRALREDDPQRHRVRHDAGLRRGLRADAGQARIRPRPRRHRRASGATAAWCAPGCST